MGASVGASRERFPSPSRASTAETVDNGIENTAAISAAVMCNRACTCIRASWN
jgi:hypothetical protein